MGPKHAPLNATECKDAKGAFVYRLCRIGETPWTLRQPQDLSNASFSELRALLVSAIAMGNQQAHTSVFLHSTSSLGKIQKILDERRSLYTNWLVRWPMHLKNVDKADFETRGDRLKWLSEEMTDSKLLDNCVQTARGYVDKDSEVVFFQHPGQRNVEWWNEEERLWMASSEMSTNFSFIDDSAATSQQSSSSGLQRQASTPAFPKVVAKGVGVLDRDGLVHRQQHVFSPIYICF